MAVYVGRSKEIERIEEDREEEERRREEGELFGRWQRNGEIGGDRGRRLSSIGSMASSKFRTRINFVICVI